VAVADAQRLGDRGRGLFRGTLEDAGIVSPLLRVRSIMR
jgi:hypothetical protein